MKSILMAITFLMTSLASASDFLTVESQMNFDKTVETLEKTIKAKGLTHFKTIAHHQGAQKVGMKLNPTTLIIFGNPKVGTQLMNDDQMMGIELPMKFLVQQDSKGKVKVSYKKPMAFKKTYKLNKKDKLMGKMTGALEKISSSVTKKKKM